MPKRKTRDDFINEAVKIYGNKYDYSKVKYLNTASKVIIICPEHGEFLKTPHHFLRRKQECKECSGYTNWNWELFTQKAREFHKGYYKYPKQPFNKIKDKYKIICPVHGEFLQAGVGHLKGGCDKCAYIPSYIHIMHSKVKAGSILAERTVYNSKSQDCK